MPIKYFHWPFDPCSGILAYLRILFPNLQEAAPVLRGGGWSFPQPDSCSQNSEAPEPLYLVLTLAFSLHADRIPLKALLSFL